MSGAWCSSSNPKKPTSCGSRSRRTRTTSRSDCETRPRGAVWRAGLGSPSTPNPAPRPFPLNTRSPGRPETFPDRAASAGAARSGNVSGRPGDRVFSGNGRGAGFGVEGDPRPARQTAPRGRVSQSDLDVVLVLLLLDPHDVGFFGFELEHHAPDILLHFLEGPELRRLAVVHADDVHADRRGDRFGDRSGRSLLDRLLDLGQDVPLADVPQIAATAPFGAIGVLGRQLLESLAFFELRIHLLCLLAHRQELAAGTQGDQDLADANFRREHEAVPVLLIEAEDLRVGY